MKTRDLILIAFYAALFVVLDVFAIFPSMPQGGSLDVAVIVLVIASYHLGVKKAFLTALVSIVIKLLFLHPTLLASDNVFYVILQVLLDYVFAYTVYAFCSLIPVQVIRYKRTLYLIDGLGLIILAGTFLLVSQSEQTNIFWSLVILGIFLIISGIVYQLTFSKGQSIALWGIVLATFIRFMFHNLSGWLFYISYYQGNEFWGVILYNASYMIPNLVFSLVIGTILWTYLHRFFKKTAV